MTLILHVCVCVVVFIAGGTLYKKSPPEGNVLLNVCKCIGVRHFFHTIVKKIKSVFVQFLTTSNVLIFADQFAIRNRWRSSKKSPKRNHWLDWAEEKYSVWIFIKLASYCALGKYVLRIFFSVMCYQKEVIQEIKMVLRVLVLYIPLPMFWALFDQQVKDLTKQHHTCLITVVPNVGL